jgi:hypothetical protein
MDLIENKPIIISAGIGGHYPAGIDRLERSLIFNGYAADLMLLKDYPPNSPSHAENPYAFKPYLFKHVFELGYKVALWLDCSIWATRNPMPMLDFINDNGLYFFKSGYPLSATATDYLLSVSGEEREGLIDVPEFATGAVGINISNPNGKDFFDKWMNYCEIGAFKGNRVYDENDSKHPLFKFSRQDQSSASMALHKMGIKNIEAPEWMAYYGTNYCEADLMFFIGGIG